MAASREILVSPHTRQRETFSIERCRPGTFCPCGYDPRLRLSPLQNGHCEICLCSLHARSHKNITEGGKTNMNKKNNHRKWKSEGDCFCARTDLTSFPLSLIFLSPAFMIFYSFIFLFFPHLLPVRADVGSE